MLGLLPWTAYNKSNLSDPKMAPSSTPIHQAPSSPAGVKRKRSGGLVATDEGSAKTSELKTGANATPMTEDTGLPVVIAHSTASQTPEGYPTPSSSPSDLKMDLSERDEVRTSEKRSRKVQKIVQQQINLEILLKHNELRLIDQEIAKCQTTLEQLRRCTEIPYPATQFSETVSSGRGLTLQRSYTGRPPASPAAWGVTDGPYSRHYSAWLLPDARFDGGEPDTPVPGSGKRPVQGRVKGNFADDHAHGVQSRTQRSSKQLKSLPAGYGQAKEKATGPLLLKRKSDGVMVKLVCPDCGRHDFGSAQGFINHCRIGHGRNFTSHDAAAEKCGEPVEYDDKGAMIGIEPVQTPTSTWVHPLIRSAKLLDSENTVRSKTAISNVDGSSEVATTPRAVRPQVSPDFRASNLTPNLSMLVKERGLGLDLQDMVVEAKTKVELPESDDEEMDESESPTPPELNGQHPHVGGTRQITKPSKSPHTSPLLHSRIAAPTSRVSRVPSQLNARASLAATDKANEFTHTNEVSPTTESNQAPSLIDDDEDFDPQSPASSSESEHADEGEVDFHVQDEDDSQQVTLRSDFQPSCTQTPAPQAHAPRERRPSALRKQVESREEKHVTFVSPSPAPESGTPDRKRRKIAK